MNRACQEILQHDFADPRKRYIFLLNSVCPDWWRWVSRARQAIYLLLFPGGSLIILIEGALNVIHQLSQSWEVWIIISMFHVDVWRLRQDPWLRWYTLRPERVPTRAQLPSGTAQILPYLAQVLSLTLMFGLHAALAAPRGKSWGLSAVPAHVYTDGLPLHRGERPALYVIQGNHNKAIPETVKSN